MKIVEEFSEPEKEYKPVLSVDDVGDWDLSLEDSEGDGVCIVALFSDGDVRINRENIRRCGFSLAEQPAPPDAERLYQAANALTSNIARGGELRGREYDALQAALYAYAQSRDSAHPVPNAERLYRAAKKLDGTMQGETKERQEFREAMASYEQSRTAPPDADRTAYDAETTFRLLGLRAAAIHFMASLPPEYRETTAGKELQYACKEGFARTRRPAGRRSCGKWQTE